MRLIFTWQKIGQSVKINNPKEVLPYVAAPSQAVILTPGVTHGS
jgi:hypothetical protein